MCSDGVHTARRTARQDLFVDALMLFSGAALAVAEYQPPQSSRPARPCSFVLLDTFTKQILRHLIATSRRRRAEPLRGQQNRSILCLHHRPSLDPLASEENSSPGDRWPMFSVLVCFLLFSLISCSAALPPVQPDFTRTKRSRFKVTQEKSLASGSLAYLSKASKSFCSFQKPKMTSMPSLITRRQARAD